MRSSIHREDGLHVKRKHVDAEGAFRGHGTIISFRKPITITEAHNAVWGGLMSAGARARGAAGVIISGRCRDIQEHRSLGFPVFARGHTTVGQSPFTRPIAVNVALSFGGKDEEVTGFPAVTVEPGDWMVADEDGVVCVPQRMVPQVVEGALKGREVDEKCMEDIKAGKGVQASFKKYRGKL